MVAVNIWRSRILNLIVTRILMHIVSSIRQIWTDVLQRFSCKREAVARDQIAIFGNYTLMPWALAHLHRLVVKPPRSSVCWKQRTEAKNSAYYIRHHLSPLLSLLTPIFIVSNRNWWICVFFELTAADLVLLWFSKALPLLSAERRLWRP